MPVRQRKLSKRTLDTEELAWLEGISIGFQEYLATEKLQALWDEHGDHDNFFWNPAMRCPEPITS